MLRAVAGGVVIDVHVSPRARKSKIAGTRGSALHVQLAAPPVDGAANAALIELLASALDVSKRSVSIVAGATSRHKRVQVTGLDVDTTAARLARMLPR